MKKTKGDVAQKDNARQYLRLSLSVAWLKANQPSIWKQIEEAAEAKFPLRRNAPRRLTAEVNAILSGIK